MDKDYKIYIFKMIKEIKDGNKNMRKEHKLLKWGTKDFMSLQGGINSKSLCKVCMLQ